MKKVIYLVATSLDGYIAHEDGSWGGFALEGEHVADYIASFSHFDTVLMGRKTYEMGLAEGKTDPYPMMESYVFSRTLGQSPDPRVTLVADHAAEVVRGLKSREPEGEETQGIYLCGGGQLAAYLCDEGLVDEIHVKLNPFLMGSGISLFAGVIRQTPLELLSSKTYDSGVCLLRYGVRGSASRETS